MGGFSLENKGALITGGGSGIGRAIAETFAAHNATVHIIDTHKEAAEATLKAIESSGGKAFIHISDVTNYSQISSIIQEINKMLNLEILKLKYNINVKNIAHISAHNGKEVKVYKKLFPNSKIYLFEPTTHR